MQKSGAAQWIRCATLVVLSATTIITAGCGDDDSNTAAAPVSQAPPITAPPPVTSPPVTPPPVTPPPAPTPPSSNGVALSWDVPTRTVDGNTLPDLTGYIIHYGKSASTLTQAIEIQSAGANTFVVTGLPQGTYYFAVRAVTANGARSELSNIITRAVS